MGRTVYLPTWIKGIYLPETNIIPEKMVSQKVRIVFQLSIFRCENVSFREGIPQNFPIDFRKSSLILPKWVANLMIPVYTHDASPDLEIVMRCLLPTPSAPLPRVYPRLYTQVFCLTISINCTSMAGWWFQPIWKICSSSWKSSPK